MRKSRCLHLIVGLLLAVVVPLGTSQRDAQAFHGHYCGGEPEARPGRYLDHNRTCRDLYGQQAVATTIRPDAHGWVCRVSGKADVGIDMQRECRRYYGNNAVAVLDGIEPKHWQCLLPAEVNGHLIPVLLFPVEKLNASEVPFVTAWLTRIEALVGGVRHFYSERTSAAVRGTKAFVLLTTTSARDWQNLAATAGQGPWRDSAYHKRVLQELSAGPWNETWAKSSARIAAFVIVDSLPPSPIPLSPPTRRSSGLVNPRVAFRFLEHLFSLPEALALGRTGLSGDTPDRVVSLPLSASNTSCSLGPTIAPEYEKAFFAVGNRFGSVLGLPRTDQYPFNDLLLRPVNLPKSIMYTGDGTKSVLFPFEAARLLPFLSNWR